MCSFYKVILLKQCFVTGLCSNHLWIITDVGQCCWSTVTFSRMVEALPNLQVVYEKWQSRNPYLHGNQLHTRSSGSYSGGRGNSYINGPRPWQMNSGNSLCPPARRRAAKERGRNRRENGLSDAYEVMVYFSFSC